MLEYYYHWFDLSMLNVENLFEVLNKFNFYHLELIFLTLVPDVIIFI